MKGWRCSIELRRSVAAGAYVLGGAAYAKDGQPAPWQMGFQPAASPIMEQITSFHTYVTVIITVIALFVLGLLVYVMARFNEKRNPDPSRTTHNTPLEIAWTVLPVLILVAIAIPHSGCLFAQYEFPKADLTITATGSQWYWTYEYPDHGITFDSIMVQDADLKAGQPRLLTVTRRSSCRSTRTSGAGQGQRRDPRLGDAVLRRQARRRSGAPADHLVQGRARRYFLRPVLRAVRPQPRLHADRRARGVRKRNSPIGSPRPRLPPRATTPRKSLRPTIRSNHCERLKRPPTSTDNGQDGQEGKEDSHGISRPCRRSPPRRSSDRLASLGLFDQPQGHRHDVPDLRSDRRDHRRRPLHRHAPRANVSGDADLRRSGGVQRLCRRRTA